MAGSQSISWRSSRGSLPAMLVLASLAALLIPGWAFAQAVDIPAIMSTDAKGPATAAVLEYTHQFQVDVEDASSEIARDNATFMLSHRFKLDEERSLVLLGNYTLQNYHFSGGRRGSLTAPAVTDNFYQWDDVHRGLVGVIYGHSLNDRWELIGGGLVRSWAEGGAEFGKSITGGFIAGFDYHPNEDFSVGLLVGAFSALEDSVGLVPVPTLKWKFAEGWRLNVGMVRVGDPGVGLAVDWQVADQVTLGAGGAYQTRRFRLADKGRVASVPRPNRTDDHGVGQETEFPVYGMVQWKPTQRMVIDLKAGVALAGNLRVEDSDGGYIQQDDYDAAPFISLKGTFAF